MDVSKLKEAFKKLTVRQKYLLAGAILVVSFLVVGTVVFLLTREEAPPPGDKFLDGAAIRQPLNYNSRNRVTFTRTVTDIDIEKFPQVLEFPAKDVRDEVEQTVIGMGLNFRAPSEVSGVLTWSNAAGDKVRFNSGTDEFSGFFAKGLALEANEKTLFDSSSNSEFIKTVFNRYTGLAADFTDVNRKRVQNGTEFISTRVILGKKLVLYGDFGYSDTITVNNDGKIASFKFYLLDETKMRKQSVSTVSPSALPNLVSRADYPKHFNQKFPLGFDMKSLSETLKEPRDVPSGLQDGPSGGVIDFPKAESCEAKGLELVYYYQSKADKYLTPTYKINCVGLIYIGGYTYDVPISVFTSAIDPTYVYVPINGQ